MSWCKSVLVAVCLSLGLSGCGFRPLYGQPEVETGPVSTDLATIRVLGIEDRSGQILRNALVQQLSPRGEPGRARYLLKVSLDQDLSGLASTEDGKATIGSLHVIARYYLTDIERDLVVQSGTARAITGMRFLGPRYASVSQERDAEERALTDIAVQIRTRLATFLATGAKPQRIEE